MSSPHASLQQRRQSASNAVSLKDQDVDLTSSLNRLSISNQPAPRSPRTMHSANPVRSSSRRSSPSPNRRLPSRSPSHGRDSRAGSPPLLRKASMNSLHSANGIGAGKSVSRRSSCAQITTPTTKTAPEPEPEKPPVTANSVASNFFRAELDAHHETTSHISPQTIVILNDAVYGHRFSRPRTSRSALSTIVERPERIKAGVLGISAAYVRLGQRHSEGAFPVHPKRNINKLPSIPFRIRKTARALPLTSQAVTNVHGTKWMEELRLMCESAESKLAMGGKELQRPDMNRGTDGRPVKLHEGDLYLCEESLNAMEGALGAVCEAVDTVFSDGPRRAFVGVRPPGHHCSASHPSGFCWVNNVHVGIMHAALQHGLTHAAIIDFDLHHGDGSQSITWAHNARSVASTKNAAPWKRTSIGYFSIHDINSYPCEMGDEEKVKNASLCIDNAHGQSIWNVHLQPWKSEQEFWQVYESKYSVLMEKTRAYLRVQAERLKAINQPPKAVIFFSAGFDASEWESSGMQRHQVNVPTEFYARLSQDVVKLAAEEDLAVDGRVISVLEGGYSDRALFSGVMSHLSGLVADQTLIMSHDEPNGLGYEMGQKIGTLPEEPDMPQKPSLSSVHPYDPSWWSSSELDKLEELLQPSSPPRKPRTTTPPTYSSPTTSSTAKVVEPLKVRRSLTGLNTKASTRPPSPPPPEVPWTIAAHELSNLLIPSHRQTDSCKAEELGAEATRMRRERQSIILGLPTPTPSSVAEPPTPRTGLRERKAKQVVSAADSVGKGSKSRRRTEGSASAASSPRKASARSLPQSNGGQTSRRASRRLSGASAILDTPSEEAPPIPPLPAGSDSSISRPGTADSSKVPGAGKINIKKTRPPTARRDTTPKTPRGRKPASRASSAKGASTAPQHPEISETGSPMPSIPNDGVDKITTGMRKVKINLITPSQKEAREKARLAADAESRAAQAAATGEPLGEASGGGGVSPTLETPYTPTFIDTMKSSPLDLAPPPDTSMTGMATPMKKPQTPSLVTPETSHSVAPASVNDESHFISYQPEGPEPVPLVQQEPLKWLPPNIPTPSANTPVATPSPIKKDNNLFHYTSGIPFAPRPSSPTKARPGSPTKLSKMEKIETPTTKSVWSIPETPNQ